MTAVRKAVERMSAEQSKVAAGECGECLSRHGGRCTIVCLANSRKYGRHCVAGVCERRRAWVRPISALSDGSLPAASILVNGEQPKLLQAVEFPLLSLQARTFGFQPENRQVAPGAWNAAGTVGARDVLAYCEDTTLILHNNSDRVPLAELRAFPREQWKSLQLVHSDGVEFYATHSASGGPQCRARIRWCGVDYHLVVTDPEIERRVHAGEAVGRDCLLTIGLGMPFPKGSVGGACFKLVAGVVEL